MMGPKPLRGMFDTATEREIEEALTARDGDRPIGGDWWALNALLWERRLARGVTSQGSILAGWSGAVLGYAAAGRKDFRDDAQAEYDAAFKRGKEQGQ